MTNDCLRELQKIGRYLNNIEPGDIKQKDVSARTCFVVINQRRLLDQTGLFDALECARLFIWADFRLFFLVNPEYPDFYAWLTFFLESVPEYLSLVFTGYPMVLPQEGETEGHPFKIKGREVSPSRIFKLVKEHKNPSSRLTFILNGCPAAESWSNGGAECDKLAVSSTLSDTAEAKSFREELPEKVLLITATPRNGANIQDRAKSGTSNFISELVKAARADPVKPASELVAEISQKLKKFGEEIVEYVSSADVGTELPFLV